MKNIYLIKDLASLTGYSIHTLKYYLRLGLLQEIGRSPITNFRFFDDSTFKRLEEIKQLRSKRIPLEEIRSQLEDEVKLPNFTKA